MQLVEQLDEAVLSKIRSSEAIRRGDGRRRCGVCIVSKNGILGSSF